MANFRPAGMSDDEFDSDEDEFYDRPQRRYQIPEESSGKRLEIDLQDAIINGNLKEVETIVTNELRNDVNVHLDSGWTPLMHACFHAQDNIVEYLLEMGANPNQQSDSITPLMLLCSNSSATQETIDSIVDKLIEKGCLLNIGDRYGQTPLMRSISSGRVAVFKQLLQKKVNIEMRDQQGWTALFWAVHHNQPEILESLIESGARVTEVDKYSRSPLDIAREHDYPDIIQILKKHIVIDDDDEEVEVKSASEVVVWRDFYPGLTSDGKKPDYKSEIPKLLYGMNCESLCKIITNSGMDLRTFLLLEDEDMLRLNIDLPYERQRLKYGLYQFHIKAWKLNAVAGLYARKMENYSILECLTTLGSHLQQVYILEATVQYVLRQYNKIQNQLKFEPPDSPTYTALRETAKKSIQNISSIRKEINVLRKKLRQINKCNPPPADLIKPKSVHERALQYVPHFIVFCSVGIVTFYTFKSLKK